jgi:DNA-binding transcriptional ArsR family regulator
MTNVFVALADPTRRLLLERLRANGPLPIKGLARPLAISRQGVTKHLRVLEEAGLIESEWKGRERWHRLNAQPLLEVDDWLRPYEEAWDRRLERLRQHLGEEDG